MNLVAARNEGNLNHLVKKEKDPGRGVLFGESLQLS